MKKLLGTVLVALATLSLSATLVGQTLPLSPTFSAGVFFSPNYNYGAVSSIAPLRVISGTSATGVGTVTLTYGYFVTRDGREVAPFTNYTTLPSITIDSGANQETVTPSSVSCSTPEVIQTCQVTATFTYVHYAGAMVQSGDGGIQEAINDAAYKGGGAVYWVIDSGSPFTLSTSAQASPFGVTIPTRSTVQGASLRVITTITGCSGGWSLGFSSGTEFGSANTTLTAGTTTDSSTLVYNYAFNASATKPEVYCTTGDATAGAVHARVWGFKIVAPAS